MNVHLVRGLWAASLIAAFAAPVNAADMSCDVPFQFVVNGKALPAGKYQLSMQGSVLLVQGYNVGGAVAVTGALRSIKDSGAKLVFHKYGERYILREAWAGGRSGRALPESAQERELKIRAANGPERVAIPAS